MSRSRRAWTETCGLVSAAMSGAGRLGTHEVANRLGYMRFARTVPSLTQLNWVATAVMFVLAINPATGLGQAGIPHSRASVAPAPADASQSRGTTRPTTAKTDPQHPRDGSADSPTSEKVLALGSGYSQNNGSSMVKAVQRSLIGSGYSPGPVDGRYGPVTEAAVIRFQTTHGLRVDGITGPLTLAALASAEPILYPGDGYAPGGSPPVRRLQRELAAADYSPGPIDGCYGPLTERAVRRFQVADHLHIDGLAGPQTARRLEIALLARVHHTNRPVGPAPRTPHHAPRHAPSSVSGTRGGTRATPPRSHRVSRSPGSLSTVWIILAAFLSAAVLKAMLWRLRPRGSDRLAATEPRPSGGGAQILDVREAAGPHEEPPEPMGRPVGPAERAGQPPADDTDSRHGDQPEAALAFDRGLQLARDGDLAGAEDAFRQSDERGHAAAAFELGRLLAEEGHRAGAKQAFERAERRGHPEAGLDLGALHLQEGDQATAEGWFRRADERGHGGAACNLGVLLEQRGDLEGAVAAYRRADERGNVNGAFNLGCLLAELGDMPGAIEALRRADERGDPASASNLGVLIEQQGDLEGAVAAYRRADERGDAAGAYNLGVLLEDEGDALGAGEAYRRGDDRGNPQAAYRLGVLLERNGDRVGAKDAYRRADQRGNPAGACGLGLLLMREGDRAGALEALERARERGSGEVADVAKAAMLDLAGTEAQR